MTDFPRKGSPCSCRAYFCWPDSLPPPLPELTITPGLALLLLAVLVQLGYAGYYFLPFARRPAEAPADQPGPDTEPVSVIVCARNEADNLRELLPLLLAQDYAAGFEIVLIDDRSTDETPLLAQQYVQLYPHKFRLVTVRAPPPGLAPKKYALTLGIRAARHARLLFTDADCRPASPQWLRLMQRGFSPQGGDRESAGADLVLGFSPYAARPGLLNQLIRYETLLTGAQYLSFAWRGQPYMGVGRNLAYTRAAFEATKGFASHLKQLSGDDDLFVQAAVKRGLRVAVVADGPAQASSWPAETWAAWWRQKRRHLSAGPAYPLADRLRLGLFLSANMAYYCGLLGLVLSAQNWVTLTLVGIFRTLVILAVYRRLNRRLQAGRPPLVLLPLLDFLYFISYLALGISLFFSRRLQWK
ncbi:glycosyltransferase [uncultured Hymenobacter sp.]|uniref:glycosyltransferase n=1 Tax=uncultured Hymenobacter sp. TaxID=170016 RepID=UPI0035C9D0E4